MLRDEQAAAREAEAGAQSALDAAINRAAAGGGDLPDGDFRRLDGAVADARSRGRKAELTIAAVERQIAELQPAVDAEQAAEARAAADKFLRDDVLPSLAAWIDGYNDAAGARADYIAARARHAALIDGVPGAVSSPVDPVALDQAMTGGGNVYQPRRPWEYIDPAAYLPVARKGGK